MHGLDNRLEMFDNHGWLIQMLTLKGPVAEKRLPQKQLSGFSIIISRMPLGHCGKKAGQLNQRRRYHA